ncbi:NifU family protein [Nocardia sp. NPDC020380]|uniref:NifU family protein n=1 Tax=Nocardia sp. NPDC020380 TaxID=3364309 RepID=UPI0037AEADC8
MANEQPVGAGTYGAAGTPGSPGKESAHRAGDAYWRDAGQRIETLLQASSAGGAAARERAEQLVHELLGLYGAALERIAVVLGDTEMRKLADDDLIASLLLVHSLHPHDVDTRVRTALDSVRPYLGSHGGDVTLLGVENGVLRLEFAGSCRTCPSSSVTLELAVEEAVRAAAPEIESIEVVAAQEDKAQSGVFSTESLFGHVRPAGEWITVPELAELAAGEVGGFRIGGVSTLACRVGDNLLVYRDHCPACGNSLAGAVLHRRMGFPAGDAVLRCPTCHAHYDAVHAGARLDHEEPAHAAALVAEHLDPLPLLMRDGLPAVAVPAEVPG